GAFVEERGVRVDPEHVGAHRATTVIEREGEPFALLVHDEALLEDPGLVNAVVAAIRLTSDNELLQCELRAQLAEVAASRSRIMEAGDLERQKIERNLHDGAQQRLVTTALSLRLAEAQLSDSSDPRVNEILSKAIAQLAEAITELRDLGRGIHPAVLTEFGLGPALNSLANRVPLSVDLQVDVPSNLPYAVSSTAYFAVSEALTNVVKHANATTVSVRATVCHDFLRVEVADDGSGGADVDAGTGLSGIADRIATVGGSLRIESPIGDGTRFALELPCASS
ncbi:MAG TPA: histidine kinase, partial [Ilumatobacteraceae bacterium]